MAQTGYTPILLYSSSTGSAAPAAGNLTNSTFGSELAINITDGKLFYKDNANAVQVIAWKTTPTTAGGTGLTSYTAGDLTYYATGTTLSKLAIGTNGQILTSTGTAPQWTTLSGVAVTSISFGTTGLTPATATQGAVTVAGTLITTNGGTGVSSYTAGDLTYYASGTALTKLAIGASGRWLGSSGTAPQWNAPAALTKTDDTNVTLTLGGSASTALLNAASLTLGWTGTLAVSRGGTGAATFTAGRVLFGNGTSAINTDTELFWDNTNKRLGVGTSTPSQLLTVNGVGRFGSLTTKIDVGLNGDSITSDGDLYIQTSASKFISIRANFTQGLRIHPSGGVSVANSTDPGADNLSVSGNVIIATSGKGIDFSATPGTGTSELLADYEEGTFTATLTPTTGSITLKTANDLCSYTKIGRQVTVTGLIIVNSVASPTGGLLLNLPFAVGTGSEDSLGGGTFVVYQDAPTYATTLEEATFDETATSLTINLNAASIGADDQFRFSFTYFA